MLHLGGQAGKANQVLATRLHTIPFRLALTSSRIMFSTAVKFDLTNVNDTREREREGEQVDNR